MIARGLGANMSPLSPPLIVGVFGDSLAKGGGDTPYPVDQPDHRILKLDPDTKIFQQGVDPFDAGPNARFSVGHPLAVALRLLAPKRTILVVNVGKAGTTTTDWLPGTGNYTEFVSNLRLALAWTPGVIGLLYGMIGQNNAVHAADATAFVSDMPAILAGLRADLAGSFLDSAHCLGMSQLCPSAPESPPYTAWANYWPDIRAAIAALAISDPELLVVNNPNGPWVEGAGLVPGLHLQTPAYELLGPDVAAAWSALVTL